MTSDCGPEVKPTGLIFTCLSTCAQSAADRYRQQAHDTWPVAAVSLFLLLKTDGTALREFPCTRSCSMGSELQPATILAISSHAVQRLLPGLHSLWPGTDVCTKLDVRSSPE